MKHRILYAGGALVALLLVGLLWVVRSGGGGGTSAASVQAPDAAPGPAYVPPVRRVPPVAAPRDATPGVSEPAPAQAGAAAAPSERIDENGNIVHDHSGEKPPARGPIASATVIAMRNTLTPLIKTCAESLAKSGTPAGSLTLVARLNVAGGKLSATTVQVSHKNFKDDAFDACVTKALGDVAMDAPAGQADTTYKLAMPFTF